KRISCGQPTITGVVMTLPLLSCFAFQDTTDFYLYLSGYYTDYSTASIQHTKSCARQHFFVKIDGIHYIELLARMISHK
ncbi:MAG TPA: hypothetical protein VEP90_30075, partial [Methylomirabilota bacterium]|nr:hypothetical protein [Methylomirabilota bacterium]